ncbi:MAG: hypothetical protein WD278_05595 [Pirellulales bacterium]
MTPRLNDEQRQALAESGGGPVEVIDERGNRRYYLVASDEYETMTRLLGAERIDPSLYEFKDEILYDSE